MNGYDIDGVLIPQKVRPQKPYIIITGRKYEEWDRTIKQIGTEAPIYMRPYGEHGDQLLAGKWKAEMINKLGIKIFYEDDPVQIKIIQENCLNVKIIQVK